MKQIDLIVVVVVCLAGLTWTAGAQTQDPAFPVYTPDNAPSAAMLDQLQTTQRVSQYGITWTFDKPARVGRFINGDYYVVGSIMVVDISPKPANGRNGSMLNIPISKTSFESKVAFDSRAPYGRYDEKLFRAPPITMKPGDVLVSSISVAENITPGKRPTMLWREATALSYVRTAAVLTCLAEPVPVDAFRPAYSDRSQRIYLARNLRRDRLPSLTPVAEMPDFAEYERIFERPWLDVVMDEFGAPEENMPVYGREFSRATSIATLMLALDIPPQQKEKLLVGVVQVGIDLWGLVQAGKPGWPPLGGHGNGRKWSIIFTGLMLDDAQMQTPCKTYPNLVFSEDAQTMFGPSWTGADVVYAGHVGKDGHSKKTGWGAYEHLPPSQWQSNIGESYRRCCTSKSWVGTALAIRLYEAIALWDHDAFLAYADRWITEDDTRFIKVLKTQRNTDYDNDWARQGMVWDPFVMNMWLAYR